MSAPGNRLLTPDGAELWRRINADERLPRSDSEASIEERLRRGQRLSAQSARLVRAVADHEDSRTGS